MIDPGSGGDWLQASLMAAALGGLAAVGRWALREEEARPATPTDAITAAPAARTPARSGP